MFSRHLTLYTREIESGPGCLLTNTFHRFGSPCNQDNTTEESVHAYCRSIGILIASLTCRSNFARRTAPHSSSLETVTGLTGVTRVFAATILVQISPSSFTTLQYTMAAYATLEASQKPWSLVFGKFTLSVSIHLLIFISFRYSKLYLNLIHSFFRSSLISSSHPILSSHNF